MKTFLLATAIATLALTACTPIPNTSQTIFTRTLFDRTTIGGPQYPVVISGAENVGLTPVDIARRIRFPVNLRGGDSTFRAVQDSPALINHARLDITPSGNNATSVLTFLHGDRRIGVGTFTLARQDYANPQALGNISATMINVMLIEAREQKFDNDERCFFPCR